MLKVIKESNKVILAMAVILVIYYYRTCMRFIQMFERDHVDLVLHSLMLGFLFIGLMQGSKRLKESSIARVVLIWAVVIVLGSLFNWIDPSSFISPLLWCVYFLVAYLFFQSEADEKVIKASSLIVCMITLVAGYFSMDIASVLGVIASSNGDYDEFLNIIGFTVTTVPCIMTLKNMPLKFILYFGIAVVSVVTARRMALIVVALILLFTFLETRGHKTTFWKKALSYLIMGAVLYFGFVYLSTYLGDSLEMALGRMTSENVMASDETGVIRLQIINDVFNAVSQSNILEWIFGHGTYGVLTVTHHTAAHNEFVEMFFDYGIVGLILLLTLHLFLIKRAISLFRIKYEYRYPYLLSYLIFFVYGAFGNVLLYAEFCLPLVLFWGYTEAKYTIIARERRLCCHK